MAELLNGTGSLDVTDASNTTRFPENMAPSAVNNGMRALEGMIARYLKDMSGSLDLAGTGSAYTVTVNADSGAALYEGWRIVAEVNTVNTSEAPTLTPTPDGGSALDTDTITKFGGQALNVGDMVAGMMAEFIFDGTNWELQNPATSVVAGVLTVEDQDAGAGIGPILKLYRNSASPAVSDATGEVLFNGEDDGGNETSYASILCTILDETGGTEDGRLRLRALVGADLSQTYYDLDSTGHTFYISNAQMFQIASDVRVGSGSAIATTATSGFLLIPGCAGTPTGSATNGSVGQVAMVFDTTNNKLYCSDDNAGTWVAIN